MDEDWEFLRLIQSLPGDTGDKLISCIKQDDGGQIVWALRDFIVVHHPRTFIDCDEDMLCYFFLEKIACLCAMHDSPKCLRRLNSSRVWSATRGIAPTLDGHSALHTAAMVNATACISFLLCYSDGSIDTPTTDGQHALELLLCHERYQVVWTLESKSFKIGEVENSVSMLIACWEVMNLSTLSQLIRAINEDSLRRLATKFASNLEVDWMVPILMARVKNYGWKNVILENVISLALDQFISKVEKKILLCEIEILLRYGAAISYKSLIRISQAGDAAVLNLVLRTEVDINKTDRAGNSALHWSLKIPPRVPVSEQLKIIRLLLKHGARVGQRNRFGLNALHIAAMKGNLMALEILLLKDSDSVNATSEMKETPLFFAARNKHLKCANLLLRWGANPEVLHLCEQQSIVFGKSENIRFRLEGISNLISKQQKASNRLMLTMEAQAEAPGQLTTDDLKGKEPAVEPPPEKIAKKNEAKIAEMKGKTVEVVKEVPLDPVAEKLLQYRLVEEAGYKSTTALFSKKGDEKTLDNFIPESEDDFLKYAELISNKLRPYEKNFHYIGLLNAVMSLSMTSLEVADAEDVSSFITAIANEKLTNREGSQCMPKED